MKHNSDKFLTVTETTGYDFLEEGCNMKPCAIDGIWTVWQEWNSCSKRVEGTRGRGRSCVGPFYGGHPCNGTGYQTEICGANCSTGLFYNLSNF